MDETTTRKFRNRIYHPVPVKEVQPGDVVRFVDVGNYVRFVVSVTRWNVMVMQPKGFKPKTWRVSRKNILEVWRWHKKMKTETSSDDEPERLAS